MKDNLKQRGIAQNAFQWNKRRKKWCRHQESNSGPADYKSAALPRLSYSGTYSSTIGCVPEDREVYIIHCNDSIFPNSAMLNGPGGPDLAMLTASDVRLQGQDTG